MDNCSYFIDNKALFGSFLSQETVEMLENEGIRVFVDLTFHHERNIQPYKTKYAYVPYPITDNGIPDTKITYSAFIVHLCDIISSLESSEKMYIHCKGGHGRSGMVVSSILMMLQGKSASEALESTRQYHQNRKKMRDKWRSIGSPQTFSQKMFIMNIGGYMNVDYKRNLYFMGNFVFPFIYDNVEYKCVREAYLTHKDKVEHKYSLLEKIFKAQLDVSSDLRSKFLSTYLQPFKLGIADGISHTFPTYETADIIDADLDIVDSKSAELYEKLLLKVKTDCLRKYPR